jgi:hypothetical protein
MSLLSKFEAWRKYNLSLQHDTVLINGQPYLERRIVYLFGFTFRLHKFFRGDDDRALHDHPWPFTTFPLTGYWERTEDGEQYVEAFRFHRRPSRYRHMVLGSHRERWVNQFGVEIREWTRFHTPRPFMTLVVTGRKDRSWGVLPGRQVHLSPRF